MTEQINVGAISEALNNKADRDLNNLNASGTSLASGWSMSSNRYIDLTLGASTSSYKFGGGTVLQGGAVQAGGFRLEFLRRNP